MLAGIELIGFCHSRDRSNFLGKVLKFLSVAFVVPLQFFKHILFFSPYFLLKNFYYISQLLLDLELYGFYVGSNWLEMLLSFFLVLH